MPWHGSQCIGVITGVSLESPQLILYIYFWLCRPACRGPRVGVGLGTAVNGAVLHAGHLSMEPKGSSKS